jgi:hypothetical protein
MARYLQQIVNFLTFAAEEILPFSDGPRAKHKALRQAQRVEDFSTLTALRLSRQ